MAPLGVSIRTGVVSWQIRTSNINQNKWFNGNISQELEGVDIEGAKFDNRYFIFKICTFFNNMKPKTLVSAKIEGQNIKK